jgi:hypothetical protein
MTPMMNPPEIPGALPCPAPNKTVRALAASIHNISCRSCGPIGRGSGELWLLR